MNERDCVALLRQKKEQLEAANESRYPKRGDFTDEEAATIKAFLGPWPRALEKADLKPPRNDDIAERNTQKRIRAKRKRREAQKNENEKTQ